MIDYQTHLSNLMIFATEYLVDYQTHLSNLMIFATEYLVQMIILMRLEGILILIQLMFMSTA